MKREIENLYSEGRKNIDPDSKSKFTLSKLRVSKLPISAIHNEHIDKVKDFEHNYGVHPSTFEFRVVPGDN